MQISNFFKTIPEVKNLTEKLGNLEEIKRLVAEKLEPSLAQNCTVSNLREGKLILSTTSPAWNHKLRFSAIDLLSSLRREPGLAGLKSIEIKVDYLPNMRPDTGSKFVQQPLSNVNASLLSQAADSIANSQLAAALRRLAKCSRSPSKDADTQ